MMIAEGFTCQRYGFNVGADKFSLLTIENGKTSIMRLSEWTLISQSQKSHSDRLLGIIIGVGGLGLSFLNFAINLAEYNAALKQLGRYAKNSINVYRSDLIFSTFTLALFSVVLILFVLLKKNNFPHRFCIICYWTIGDLLLQHYHKFIINSY